MAYEPIAGADGSKYEARPRQEEIVCPWLATLYNNGDLVPDADGIITYEQVEAILRMGCVDDGIRELLASKCKPQINLFEMGTTHSEDLEHTFSTGIRDPKVDPDKFEEFAKFANKDGRFYSQQLSEALWHFSKHFNDENPNAASSVRGGDLAFIWAATLDMFGRDDGKCCTGKYLTVEDLRRHFLEGRYPEGWQVRDWKLGSICDEILRVFCFGLCMCACCCASFRNMFCCRGNKVKPAADHEP